MLISAIGKTRLSPNTTCPSKQAGFTLVEVMISLFIMGVMASVVIINLPRRENQLVIEANKLATHLQMAAQTSLIEQYPLGVLFQETGYSMVKYDGTEWVELMSYEFNDGQTPTLILSQNGAVLDMETVKKSLIPIIRYDTTGLATPFKLSILFGGDKINLAGGVDGRVVVSSGGN